MKTRELDKLGNIFMGIAMGLLLIGLIIFGIIEGISEKETHVVDCFDRYGNKIIDQVCLEDKVPDEVFYPAYIMVIIAAVFAGLGILTIILWFIKLHEECN